MKAASYSRFGGPEVLEIVERPDPHPGPAQIRIAVRAAGVNPTDLKARQGLIGGDLPQMIGYDVAGIVDELGQGVTDVEIGDRVFGFSDEGAGSAELTLLSNYAPIPATLSFVDAAALPVAIEVATRTLDGLGVAAGDTLLINGAAGGIGSAAVQLARSRGARVIGIDGPARLDYLRSLGADPVLYGAGVVGRVRALAPDGIDLALDIAGNGILPELIQLAGAPDRVVTVADFAGAQQHGVKFSRGDDGRAVYVLGKIGGLIESGQFSVPATQTFPLSEIAEAHRAVEGGLVPAKVVLLVG